MFLSANSLSGFLGQDARTFLLGQTALLPQLHYDTIKTNLKSLQNAEIPDSTILANCTTLLTYNPHVLADRLMVFTSCPEISFLSYNMKFPVLLENIETVVVRVQGLRRSERSSITITACMCPPSE